MLDNFSFTRISTKNEKKLNQVREFVNSFALSIDRDVEYFVIGKDEHGDIIACGGIAGFVLKTIAVDEKLKGTGFSLTLMSELTNFAYELGRYNLFMFTKPQYEAQFRQAGFFLIEKVDEKVALLENSPNRINNYKKSLNRFNVTGKRIGSIVMNANPFTLGHQYLIEKACSECDWVHLFTVKEEGKDFSYEDRLAMIQLGTQHLNNITIHRGSDYIISKATFPSYFIKDQKVINYCHTALDLKLFRKVIAPALHITHRYVGTEPLCPVTSQYNEAMHRWLETAELASPSIDVIQVARKVTLDAPISASRVRQLILDKNYSALTQLVPKTTIQYLKQHHFIQPETHTQIDDSHKQSVAA